MKIIKKLFCGKCKYVNDAIQIIDEKDNRNNLLNLQKSHYETLTLINKIDLINEQIIYITENWNDHDYIVLTVQEEFNQYGLVNSINFYCYTFDIGYDNPQKVMRMFTDVHYSTEKTYVESIEIVDIIGVSNRGYGSIIMVVFMDYIRQFKPKEIYGYLSFVDELDTTNKEIRNHFYQKHGFIINGNRITRNI